MAGPSLEERRAQAMMTGYIARLSGWMPRQDQSPTNQFIYKKLDEPVIMSFANPTPIEDILKYIKAATTGKNDKGLPIYVDPAGLDQANTTLSSPIMLDLEGIPLKTTLRLALKQLGLAYCVRDGVLIISSVKGIYDELSDYENSLPEDAVPPVKNRGFQ